MVSYRRLINLASHRHLVVIAVALSYFMSFLAGYFILGMLDSVNLHQISSTVQHKILAKGQANGRFAENRVDKCCLPEKTANSSNELVSLNDNLRVGDEAEIVVRTQPGQICTIRFVNPAGVDEALPISMYQQSGEDGLCSWRWKLSPTIPEGMAAIIFSAGGHTQSYFIRIKS